MAPRIIYVELHAVPLLLAEIHLESVIIAIPARFLQALRYAAKRSTERIDLKEVERVGTGSRVSKVRCAGRQRRAREITNVRYSPGGVSQSCCQGAGRSLV